MLHHSILDLQIHKQKTDMFSIIEMIDFIFLLINSKNLKVCNKARRFFWYDLTFVFDKS